MSYRTNLCLYNKTLEYIELWCYCLANWIWYGFRRQGRRTQQIDEGKARKRFFKMERVIGGRDCRSRKKQLEVIEKDLKSLGVKNMKNNKDEGVRRMEECWQEDPLASWSKLVNKYMYMIKIKFQNGCGIIIV